MDRDEQLAKRFETDGWWQDGEPAEITGIAKSITANPTGLRHAATDKAKPASEERSKDDPQPYEKDRCGASVQDSLLRIRRFSPN